MPSVASRPLAMVTGASSGIGVAFAERLAADGCHVILVARRQDRLEALAAELDAKGQSAEVMVADLAEPADVAGLAARLAAEPADYLVNNAGFGAYGAFIEADPEVLDRQIAVHISATVRLVRAALPGMVARGAGSIVNVASTFAFSSGVNMPARKRANYVASKAFLVTLTELLSHELEGTGVAVQVLCPGVVRTEFHSTLGGRPPGVAVFEPADVVAASLQALALGETICIPQLADPEVLDRLVEARNAVWDKARGDTVAGRYKD